MRASLFILSGLAALTATTVAAQGTAPRARSAPITLTAAERAAAKVIEPNLLRGHVRFLAHDLLEGRGPASRGDRLAQLYIASQMEAMGLQPGAPDGTWYQPFDLVGINTHTPPTLTLTRGAERVELKQREDFIAVSGLQQAEAGVKDAEVVFVGYGIVAPEYGWDDYKGVDLAGKIVMVMNNDPEDDPKLFAGRTRLYYGRWGYKYESAARAGAAGAIIIHTVPSAGYKWQVVQTSWSGEQFALPYESGPQLQVKAWATEDASRRIAKLGGQDLSALMAAAQKKDFKPVPLGVSVSVALKAEIQKKQTANVIGRLPGSDAALRSQAVVYTAHHDHLGIDADAKAGADAIYNGALDNATGVGAMLAVARAMTSMPAAPRRTVLFAAVAAEEQGLLGSQYFAAHPPLHAGKIAANINIDGLNIWGRTRDLTMVGLGKSDLDRWIHGIAKLQGRTVVADQSPDKGFFYRSDQFNLAKIGVPAAYFDAGTDVIGKPKGWGKEQQDKFESKDYHQPSDELRADWDFSGGVEDVQLYFFLGSKVANQERMPSWNPGDEFEAARKKAVSEAP